MRPILCGRLVRWSHQMIEIRLETPFRTLAALLALTVGGCSGTTGSSPVPAGAVAPLGDVARSTSPIQHVVVIMQENRSVDNLFHGFPGADTVSSGDGHGKKYTLKPVSLANG